ncbi:nucleotide exchange factor GrpE [Desulfobacter hydrogenophilus]|nr:nucleotide exchange factor GrpE [Desulfobacter hydrogenophilus]NDY72227.1 nucleotide exchange factor GrpE [Desulfobacter hydrogenophilus]
MLPAYQYLTAIMGSEKEQLKKKLIDFQQQIAGLKLDLAAQAGDRQKRENEFFTGLLDIMDAFELIEDNLESKKESLDKPARMLGKNIRSIHKKLSRYFNSVGISPIAFEDGKAVMEQCKVLETRADPGQEDGTLFKIVKKGYLNTRDGTILRKAEVITIRNDVIER